MFIDIVRNMELDGRSKMVMETMAQRYEDLLPSTLSMNHYELSDKLGFSSQQWKDFLKNKEIEHLIESEMANIAEIGARKALERLQSGNAASADIQAAKEVLSNSRILKQKTNHRPQVVITRIPEKRDLDAGT